MPARETVRSATTAALTPLADLANAIAAKIAMLDEDWSIDETDDDVGRAARQRHQRLQPDQIERVPIGSTHSPTYRADDPLIIAGMSSAREVPLHHLCIAELASRFDVR